jgi:hypothetical protein
MAPIGTPNPGDEAVAARLTGRFERAIVNGNWAAAWNALAPEVRATSSPEHFAFEAAGEYEHVDGVFDASPPRHDAAEIMGWVFPANYPLSPAVVTTANLDRAFVIDVTYPRVAEWCAEHAPDDTGCGTQPHDVLLVAPDAGGSWWVWFLD